MAFSIILPHHLVDFIPASTRVKGEQLLISSIFVHLSTVIKIKNEGKWKFQIILSVEHSIPYLSSDPSTYLDMEDDVVRPKWDELKSNGTLE